MNEKIQLLIADDHRVVREGLKAFIAPTPGLEIIGEASNGAEAVELASRLKPDVVLLDLMMSGMDGIEATQQIRQNNPNARVVIITSFMEEDRVIHAVKAGAAGYLLKDSSPLEIENAIREVAKGGSAFPSRIASILVKEINRPQEKPKDEIPLTERETEILKLIARGYSNQQIADELFLSVWTVRTYVSTVLEKLAVENRTLATLYALREGLVKLEQ
ncbi:MAG: response regulator transcription factor [Chloroflexi bacterium]|nr:response regulator transcription factor [Chloroflexota bacterium]